jgi:hypothetical protein
LNIEARGLILALSLWHSFHVYLLFGSRKVGSIQETRAAGRYLLDPSPPPGSDPEHRDSALGRAVEACDRNTRAVVLAPESALDLGSRCGLTIEQEHSGLCLGSLEGSSDLLVNRLEFGSSIGSSDLTSSDAGKERSAEGVCVGRPR